LKEQVQIEATNIYGNDQVILNQISYSVNHMDFIIDYNQKDNEKNTKKLMSLAKAIDQNHISREGYRAIAAIESNLDHEWVLSEQRLKITKAMNRKIAITNIDIPLQNELYFAEDSNISGVEIFYNVNQNIGKGGYRSAKDILIYVIPILILDGILDVSSPTIHLRISGDGRNVGRKIKHVMVTIAILNDKQNIYVPDRHYTTVLFSGNEKYEILETMMAPFIQELDDLKNNGLIIDGICWNFELYFSSDWKFLVICLGFNSPNSNHYCPWCQVSKNSQSETNWGIEKKMEQINESLSNYPGHIKKPLFHMISLDHWIPDELHVMLRIWDRLWSLVLAELKESDQFDDICRFEITQEMDRIGVKFQFWNEHNSNSWNHTSLMGDDKLKVLENFNLKKILPPSRADKIRQLWDGFKWLYHAFKSKNYDPQQFKFEAEEWLELFLTPDKKIPNSTRIVKGLYNPSAITPYMHVLVCHMHEFMEMHQQWGISSFSCSPVEKKNHQQVSFFFRQTVKDGGNAERKSSIMDILEYENRSLFYLFDDVATSMEKPKKLHIS